MTFYFVRHGETDWNVKKKIQGSTDIPLNENGLRQAAELAEALLKRKQAGLLDAVCVYTSPQKRAVQTAQAAAEALDIPCRTEDGLREMNLGDWEGANWQVIEEQQPEVYHYWNTHRRYTHTPHGESYNEVLARTLLALSDILERESRDVLVVTHSAVLMALRCYLAGLPFEEMAKRFRTKNAQIVEAGAEGILAAITRFKKGE